MNEDTLSRRRNCSPPEHVITDCMFEFVVGTGGGSSLPSRLIRLHRFMSGLYLMHSFLSWLKITHLRFICICELNPSNYLLNIAIATIITAILPSARTLRVDPHMQTDCHEHPVRSEQTTFQKLPTSKRNGSSQSLEFRQGSVRMDAVR